MYKYILFFIIGILIFLLLDNGNSFSVGNQALLSDIDLEILKNVKQIEFMGECLEDTCEFFIEKIGGSCAPCTLSKYFYALNIHDPDTINLLNIEMKKNWKLLPKDIIIILDNIILEKYNLDKLMYMHIYFKTEYKYINDIKSFIEIIFNKIELGAIIICYFAIKWKDLYKGNISNAHLFLFFKGHDNSYNYIEGSDSVNNFHDEDIDNFIWKFNERIYRLFVINHSASDIMYMGGVIALINKESINYQDKSTSLVNFTKADIYYINIVKKNITCES